MPQPTPQASSDPSSTGVTVRSVSVGLFFVAFINLWVTYSETVVHASRLNLSVFQLTLLATFVVLVAVINPLLSRIRASAALTEPELITVVAIAIVGAVVPASGVTGFLIGVISTPLYFASPENGWAEFYHPNLPSWAVPAFGLLAWNTLTWLYPLIPSIDIFPHAGKFRFTRYSPHV
jgi:hypothetical protein